MGSRRRAREFALQMLFQIDLTGVGPAEVFADFWDGQDAGEEVRRFAEQLVLGVRQALPGLDAAIAASATHWRIDRMAVVDRNVLRMAVFELSGSEGVPAPVVIDEAIEVARKFGGEESSSFINGILDDVRRRLDRGEMPARA